MDDAASEAPDTQDPFSRLQYRRLVAWPERIRREEPFLESVFGAGPERSILDLGCATGEHALHFARRGYRVLGLDRSQAQIDEAQRQAGDAAAQFVCADLTHLQEAVGEKFGSAVCLGNTLVNLLETSHLESACRGVYAALLPGGSWVTQILNYRRILATGQRSLPLNFRPDGDAELVFLRLMRPLENGRIQFIPTTLRLAPEAEPPVQVVASHAVTLRAWSQDELERALGRAGFEAIRWFGDMTRGAYDPETSTDLVFVATRR
ncbi:MAG: class I SAM-dependent methyltransferase [Candidatus Krumholzibacteriia bacterium]